MSDVKAFILSMFSKKFLAFVAIEVGLFVKKQWSEMVAAFIAYCTAEVVDKKTEDKAVTTPEPVIEEG